MRFLLSLWWFALVAAQNNDWCSSSSILCGTSANVQTDLSCGVCRSWTYSANIAGNTLRMLGLDGGATAGDGNSNNTYMVYATLDTDFDLTNGKNWLLELLPSSVSHILQICGTVQPRAAPFWIRSNVYAVDCSLIVLASCSDS